MNIKVQKAIAKEFLILVSCMVAYWIFALGAWEFVGKPAGEKEYQKAWQEIEKQQKKLKDQQKSLKEWDTQAEDNQLSKKDLEMYQQNRDQWYEYVRRLGEEIKEMKMKAKDKYRSESFLSFLSNGFLQGFLIGTGFFYGVVGFVRILIWAIVVSLKR